MKGEQMGAVQGSRMIWVGCAVLAVCVALAIVVVCAMAAADEYQLRGSFGPDGTSGTSFSEPGSVAVDQESGVVYVIDQGDGSLYKFDLEGHPVPFGGSAPYISGNKISGLTFFVGEGNNQVAVDSSSHEFYVTSSNSVTAFQANGEPAEFSAGPGAGTNAIGGFTRLTGMAVDSNGAIYAGDRDADVVRIFAPSGEEITQFSAPEAGNLAIDSNGALYVNRRVINETVLKYGPSAFPVTSSTTYSAAAQPLSDKGSYTVAVDRSTNEVYVTQAAGSEAKVVIYDEDGNIVKSFAGAGEEGQINRSLGVSVDEAAGLVFVADEPASGLSQVKIFSERVFTPESPTVESVSITDVASDSAIFAARVNPNTLETTYHFEYGPEDCAVSTCISVPLGGANIGSGHEPIAVSQEVDGLQPDSTYHFRVVAENQLGDNLDKEADHTFTTQGLGLVFQLPDRRAWEMVSPIDKAGAIVGGGLLDGQVQAAADGNGLAYLTYGSIESGAQGSRESSSVLAHRDGAEWRSEDISLPNSRVVPPLLGGQGEYKLFNQDLSESLVEPRVDTNLSPEASGLTPYLRENTRPPLFRPLLTSKEGFANVPPGTRTDEAVIKAATPDFAHVALKSTAPLVAGAPAPSLYLWSDGQVEPINVLPSGEGGALETAEMVGSSQNSVRHAISDDGSRVFWTALSPPRLYMREAIADETIRIDLQAGGSGAGAVNPVFQGASADGSVVFFTDTQQLTEGASPSGADLYRCEIPLTGPLTGCASLSDVSAPLPSSGESAEVLGMAPAFSEDGSMAYFVARGVLDTEPNEASEKAHAGEPNLYLWQEGKGIRFVATLATADDADWGMPGTVPAPGRVASLSAASSLSGRYFAFMSEQSLTGEANLDPLTGSPVERIFRYDAGAERLDCISCDPTGAAPSGRVLQDAGSEDLSIDPREDWAGGLVNAVLPEPTLLRVEGTSLYRTRVVLDNGRVFFNAADPLVPGDSNSQWDVYQYEGTGVGTCSNSSGDAATSRSAAGCVSLLSSGTSSRAAAFLDASVDGDDVFFLTQARLSVRDEDDETDIYDARVDGVPAVLSPRTECSGEACHSLAPVPGDPTLGSATFQGLGNSKVHAGKRCPKGKRKVRRNGWLRCVPRKHHKSQDHQRAGKGRGAGQ